MPKIGGGGLLGKYKNILNCSLPRGPPEHDATISSLKIWEPTARPTDCKQQKL